MAAQIAEKQSEIDALEAEKETMAQDLAEMGEEKESLARNQTILLIALVLVAVAAVVLLGAFRYRGSA